MKHLQVQKKTFTNGPARTCGVSFALSLSLSLHDSGLWSIPSNDTCALPAQTLARCGTGDSGPNTSTPAVEGALGRLRRLSWTRGCHICHQHRQPFSREAPWTYPQHNPNPCHQHDHNRSCLSCLLDSHLSPANGNKNFS